MSKTNPKIKIQVGNCISELPKSELPASAAIVGGNYPFFCSSSEPKQIDKYIQDKPAILLGTGGVASVNFGDDRFAYSTDTWGIRSTCAELPIEFLYWKLQQLLPEIDFKGFEGSGLRHLRKTYIRGITFEVSENRNVSQKIATILTTIDTAIEKTQELIDKYQKIKTGLMNDLFTRGIGSDGKLRPPRSEAPELYKKTELGWIPKEWEVKTIREISGFVTSGSRGWARYYSEEGAKFIRIGNLTRENIHLRLTDLKCVAVANITEGKRTKLISGDVLISITADLGIIGLVPENFGEAYINQHIALVRPQINSVEGEWIATWLTTNTMQNIFQILNDPGAKSGLNLPTIRKLQVCTPRIKERKLIFRILNENDKYVKELKEELIKFQEQKTGLMQDLLTGKVEVTVPEEEAAHA